MVINLVENPFLRTGEEANTEKRYLKRELKTINIEVLVFSLFH